MQLVARKVAAVSGDARRALDICRRSTEIADADSANVKCVTMLHVQQALAEMIASAKVQAIKNCSRLEQIFLQAVAAEVTRTGVEETTFMGVYTQVETIAAFMGRPCQRQVALYDFAPSWVLSVSSSANTLATIFSRKSC